MKNIFKISCAFSFSLIIVLTFSCVSQIINITQENYLAQECQKKINAISRESLYTPQGDEKILSLREIETMARERSFTHLGTVTYLKVSAPEVVVR